MSIIPLMAVIIVMLFVWLHVPIITCGKTKQTIYLWFLNNWHIQSKDAKPRVLLIDDDSGNGVFSIKRICDELHMKATFAIIPAQISKKVCDSIRVWQKEGFGIALHGYNHDDWREYTYEEILEDIDKSEKWLSESGFMPLKSKLVVAPRGSNTRAIRKAIKTKGYQMVTGASLLNPDTQVFQLGRIFIAPDTNIKEMEQLLIQAKEHKLFVIFGTHSSIPNEFSEEKTKEVLQMAQNMRFQY